MKLNRKFIILGAFLLAITSGSIALPIFLNDHNSISQNTEINSYVDDSGINLRCITKVEHTTPEENANKENVQDNNHGTKEVDTSVKNSDSDKSSEKDINIIIEEPIEVVISEPKEDTEEEYTDNTEKNDTNNESESKDNTSEDEIKVNDEYIQELIEENKENIEEEDLETGNSIYEKLDTDLIFALVEDGLTDEEKKQIKDHMHEVLTDEEYATTIELFSKYIGLTE